MTPCARSHTVPGEHAPPCTCTRECPEHDDHCNGCLPVQADRGLLCARCADRLEGFLGGQEGLAEDPEREVHGLPWAWEHLATAWPSLSQAPSSGGSTIEDAEAQRVAAVVSARDDIHDTLRQWVEVLTEQTGLSGPDLTFTITARPEEARTRAQGIRVSRYANWLLRHIEPLLAGTGVAPSDLDVAAMLSPGEGMLEQDTPEQDLADLRARQVVAVWDELGELMSRAHALAPWRPVPTKLEGIPCRCGALALHDYGTEIQCSACRWNFSRETYRIWTVVLGRRYEDEPEHQVEAPRLEHGVAGYGGRA